MLADVITIISEQLGTSIEKVNLVAALRTLACNIMLIICAASAYQVQPDSKFVDLGADSLDTVRGKAYLRVLGSCPADEGFT